MQLKKIHIIKICLIGFLLSFTLIYLIEKNYKMQITEISNINSSLIEKNIKIEGKIIKQTLIKDILFFTLKDNTSQINIITFQTNQTLNKNQTYTVEGKITSYNKELEIIANKIEIKN